MNQNIKTALIVGGVVLAILIILPMVLGLVSGGQSGGWGMMGPGIMGGWGWMWFMPVLWLLFLGLIIWAIVAAVRGTGTSTGSSENSALEVLKKRYARGEISKEEFEEKKKDLV